MSFLDHDPIQILSNAVLQYPGVPAELPPNQLLQQLHPVCLNWWFCTVPEAHLSKLHRHRHGRHLKSFARKTPLLYFTTAFLEVYFSLPYIDLADKTLTKEIKRNWSALLALGLIHGKAPLGSSLQILWWPSQDALSTRAWQSSWRLERELSTIPICLRMSPL